MDGVSTVLFVAVGIYELEQYKQQNKHTLIV